MSYAIAKAKRICRIAAIGCAALLLVLANTDLMSRDKLFFWGLWILSIGATTAIIGAVLTLWEKTGEGAAPPPSDES